MTQRPAPRRTATRRYTLTLRRRLPNEALLIEDFEALMETLDVLADPALMKAIQSSRNGESSYRLLDLDDENFGL